MYTHILNLIMKNSINSSLKALLFLGLVTLFTNCSQDETLSKINVTTESVDNITVDGARCRGFLYNTENLEITSVGICWSNSQNPTTQDSLRSTDSNQNDFNYSLSGLTPGTVYYVRSFVVKADNSIAYGNQQTFKTLEIPTFNMVTIPGGTFTMGGTFTTTTPALDDNYPTHLVTLSTFKMGETEVTQKLWVAIMGSNPSFFVGEDLPVESVNYQDIQLFLQKLNQVSGKSYRLPTESEWEYAAGGGADTLTLWAGTSDFALYGDYMWHNSNSTNKTHPVGTKLPNTLGLYDMSGNVWEWCSDLYASKYQSADATNPTGPLTGTMRVIRGGAYSVNSIYAFKAFRSYNFPEDRKSTTGFRLVQNSI